MSPGSSALALQQREVASALGRAWMLSAVSLGMLLLMMCNCGQESKLSLEWSSWQL